MLSEQGYEYLPIHSEAELIANLRKKLGLSDEIRTISKTGYRLEERRK